MGRSKERMLIAILVLVAGGYAIAEDIILTSYYPSPRGVYDALRSNSNFVRGGDGDMDNSGAVTIADINAANICASGTNGSTSPNCAFADVNGDGVVNELDVNTINQGIFLAPPLVNNRLRDAAKGIASRLVAPKLNGDLHLGVPVLGNPVAGACPGISYWVDVNSDRVLGAGECGNPVGTQGIEITEAGSVGVGTVTPTAKLHVVETGVRELIRLEDQAVDPTPFAVGTDGTVGINWVPQLGWDSFLQVGGAIEAIGVEGVAGGPSIYFSNQTGPGDPTRFPFWAIGHMNDQTLRWSHPIPASSGGGLAIPVTLDPAGVFNVQDVFLRAINKNASDLAPQRWTYQEVSRSCGQTGSCPVACPANTTLLTGGCICSFASTGDMGLTRNQPSGNGWDCGGDCNSGVQTFARCINN